MVARPSWPRSALIFMLHPSFVLAVRCLQPLARSRAPAAPLHLIARPKISRDLGRRRLIMASDESSSSDRNKLQPMENLYREWTPEQDMELYENRNLSLPELAARVGRGLRGVESRLKKLKDVNHAAYQRLFSQSKSSQVDDLEQLAMKTKLVPVTEVLRRVKWSLDPADFSFLHFDRVDETMVESSFTAPNDSVSGKATLLVDAIPEHRIMAVKYRERVVWDRKQRLDLVFDNGGINAVIVSYDDWTKQQSETEAFIRQKREEISDELLSVLGAERFNELQQRSLALLAAAADPTMSTKKESEKFISFALDSFMGAVALMSELEYLDLLSEFVALLPDDELRQVLLTEISLCMAKVTGNKAAVSSSGSLPELDEADLVENFIRGSGPGGQKVNKTSNRVLLVHTPTNLRVECQDTRSLHQNRKIARKRLRSKLDEYLNGSQSVANIKASKASDKKSKAKARSRKRQRQKQQANESSELSLPEDEIYE